MKKPLLTLMVCCLASVSQAAVIQFNLIGTAGAGLLPGNEPAVASGGTGGEIGTGITFDDVTNLLTLNVGWGSSQGFADLSSLATNSHIHGPTANNNGNGFIQTAGVVFSLTRSSNAVTGGTITNAPILLTSGQEIDLLNGKYYINIHTANNPGGEMRGFLVPVPEPGSMLLGMVALGALSLRRRRR
jgi:CHRD domain/PEP-CTERM motif